MSTIDKIIEYTKVEFKNKLDMLVPELADRVQYMGWSAVGSRPTFIFRTSINTFEFRVRGIAPIETSDIDKVPYFDLYQAFKNIKYEHLHNKSRGL
jgi:hypothetical protein